MDLVKEQATVSERVLSGSVVGPIDELTLSIQANNLRSTILEVTTVRKVRVALQHVVNFFEGCHGLVLTVGSDGHIVLLDTMQWANKVVSHNTDEPVLTITTSHGNEELIKNDLPISIEEEDVGN